MKHLTALFVFCLMAIGCIARSVNAMTYDQMWESADSVLIGHVVGVEVLSDFEAPKELGPKAGLKCYVLTIKVHCVLKGAKQTLVQVRSYDYLRSGDPKKDFLLDVNSPSFIAEAAELRKTDALWFLLHGEPVTGQMDAHLAVIPISTDHFRPEHWPNQMPEPTAASGRGSS